MENPESSNDVVIVESNDPLMVCLSEHEDIPLMMLFKRLIGNDNKQNTVLTNAQIINILQKEFNMDVIYAHELEIDIYLNVLKKFLKDWPQWAEFDSTIHMLRNQKDNEKTKAMLLKNYSSLKSYLRDTLNSVEPLLKTAIEGVTKATVTEEDPNDNVSLQLTCSRRVLNNLIYRRPHPKFNNAIFCVEPPTPKIILSSMPLESILNFPSVKVSINLNRRLILKRTMFLSLSHVIVNKKLNIARKKPEKLSTKYKVRGQNWTSVDADAIMRELDRICAVTYKSPEMQSLIQAICRLFKSDLQDASRFYTPAVYRKILSPYPYVRRLFTEVQSDQVCNVNGYDLHMEETGVPLYMVNIARFHKYNIIPNHGAFVTVECTSCQIKLSNTKSMYNMIMEHFRDNHYMEPDWQCSRCNMTLSMVQITQLKWQHICEMADDD